MYRRWPCWIGIACLALAAPGCARFWDEMLSHECDWSYATGFGKPNPLVVIRDTTDGERRAQALSELREPLQTGGNAQDQEAFLNILRDSATKDPEPLCRLTAVRALGRFSDPRAARILEDVYQSPKLPFTPENNSMIRKESLVALESTKDPEAWKFLVRVARQPGPPANADRIDRQQTQDEKLVAIRALSKYKQQECVEALMFVMRTEKDISLRNCACRSLEETTGKRWPVEFATWQREGAPDPLPGEPGENFIQRVVGYIQK